MATQAVAQLVRAYSGFSPLAEEEGFVAVFPAQGTEDVFNIARKDANLNQKHHGRPCLPGRLGPNAFLQDEYRSSVRNAPARQRHVQWRVHAA